MCVPAGLFLCAGAVLESHRLAMVSFANIKCPMWPKRVPRHPRDLEKEPKVFQSMSPRLAKAVPMHPQDAPMQSQVLQIVSQGSPRQPNGTPKRVKEQCRPQRMPGHFKASSKKAYIHKNSRSTAATAIMLASGIQLQYGPYGSSFVGI